MKKFLMTASIVVLAGCQTTGPENQPSDEVVVTSGKRIAQSNTPPAVPLASMTCWDGSLVFSSAQCPAEPSQSLSIAPAPVAPVTAFSPNQSTRNLISAEPRNLTAIGNGQTLEVLQPEYETVTETITVQNAAIEFEVVPPVYEWVNGVIEGGSTELVMTPPQYETVTETVVVQEASSELVSIPPTYNSDGTVATPAQTVERAIPAVTKMETRRVVKTPAATTERYVPNVVKDGKTRIQTVPPQIIEKPSEAVTQEVSRRVPKGEPRYVIRDESGQIVREFQNRDEFEKFSSNPYKRVVDSPVSTFSSDVDTASYSVARSYLNRGQRPPKDAIRIEEVLNYFDYDYDKPRSKSEPFKPSIAVVPSPWNSQTKLVHIGVQGYESPKSKRPAMNLVFLIDISGSMKAENKLPLLKQSLDVLLKELGPNDRVSIVTYGPVMETVLIPTPGNRISDIRAAIEPLQASGGTNGEAGLQQAYRVAEQSFLKDGTNRVILATDGDFNIGIKDPTELKTFVEDKRDTGVYLSVLGFGNGNLKDNRMQAIAQNGNGTASYIDTLSEAKKIFGTDFTKSLVPIADDLKLQVEFNPSLVSEYRLLGYETRALKRQDFNNDKVDAGDIGAGHSVTAIYEVLPVGATNKFVDPLRYGSTEAPSPSGEFSGEYGFLKLRYKKPGEAVSTLISTAINTDDEYSSLKRAPKATQWAVSVGGYAMALRDDGYTDDLDMDVLTDIARRAKGRDRYGYRSELLELMDELQEMGTR